MSSNEVVDHFFNHIFKRNYKDGDGGIVNRTNISDEPPIHTYTLYIVPLLITL